VHDRLEQVSQIREQQMKLFNYLLTNHATNFTFLVQSCEDRVGHWLYPIQTYNVGYNPKVHTLALVLQEIIRELGANRGGQGSAGRILQPTTQPTNLDVLYDLAVLWQSARSCKWL
jgi:hypothetical protein